MKKKNIILVASLSMVASLGIAGGVLASSANSAAAVKADGEKTIEYVNVTTQAGLNSDNMLLNIDKPIEGESGSDWKGDCYWREINVTHNNASYIMGLTVFPSDTDLMYVGWGSTYPNGTGYHHWRLNAGTVLFETDETKYVLEKDYNWWQARQSAGSDSATWIFQHGGTSVDTGAGAWNSEIPSFSLADGATGRIDIGSSADGSSKWSRYWISASYTKTSNWKSTSVYSANAFYYSFDDSNTYSLAYNGDSDGHELNLYGAGGGIEGSTDLSGTEHFLFNFSGLGTTTGTDKFVSFYLPKGTLFGGYNEGYGCYLENDYYVTIMNDKIVGGTTTSTQDLIYGPVKTFISNNMHMGEADYDGEGTGACAAIYSDVKTAYNALSENQKYAFLNYSGYTDAKARLLAWAAANGDALDTSNNIVTKKSSSLILKGSSSSSNIYAAAICAGALALVAGGAFFVFKKKHEN